MRYIVQVDFPHNGPFGEAFEEAFAPLANDIKDEEGLIWKIWTENEAANEAGGIYLFDNKEDAKRYFEKHCARLESFGYKNIRAKIFKASQLLSHITKAMI